MGVCGTYESGKGAYKMQREEVHSGREEATGGYYASRHARGIFMLRQTVRRVIQRRNPLLRPLALMLRTRRAPRILLAASGPSAGTIRPRVVKGKEAASYNTTRICPIDKIMKLTFINVTCLSLREVFV